MISLGRQKNRSAEQLGAGAVLNLSVAQPVSPYASGISGAAGRGD